jgi:hypothetical protein
MPRGSKPNERRGGRQLGTPNKKTLLKLAAMNAAGEDASPLEFLLRLMRDPTFPISDRLNAAAEAAQYLHARPRQGAPETDALVRVVEDGPHGFGPGAIAQFFRVLSNPNFGTDVETTEVSEEPAELLPLQFMLEVMRDPGVAPHVRFKAVKLAARYSHTKQPAAPGGDHGRAVLDNRYGFKIPPELAVRFWRPAESLDVFLREMIEESGGEHRRKSIEENNSPRARADRSFGPAAEVALPDGYAFLGREKELLDALAAKREVEPLTPAEEFAEAHLRTRASIYLREQEKAPLRIEQLEEKLRQNSDPQMQRERDELLRRFPDVLVSPVPRSWCPEVYNVGKYARLYRLEELRAHR